MSTEDLVYDLVAEWDRRQQEGEDVSAEIICAEHPELAQMVAERIASVKKITSMMPNDDDEDDDFLSLPNFNTQSAKEDDTLDVTTQLSLDEFASCVTSAGLMTADQMSSFQSGLLEPVDATELARQLVQKKRLTKFQAETICEGKSDSLVYGDYVILDRIGAGGMGQVFKARHRRMKRVVALKILPPEAVSSPNAVERFEREVEAAARLIHPNIVTAYDAREEDGVHYLVMECVEGSDLSDLVKKKGPLSVAKAVNYIKQAATGLAFAHGKGVVHRDIKPANLLLDGDGVVKILDMGLARLEQPTNGSGIAVTQAELTQDGSVLGTIDYMSPEQALDTKHADARADIYSLGCTLYYILTGGPVFVGNTLMARMLAHREGEIPSLVEARSDVPDELDAVFRKMVAKEPGDRYQTGAELLSTLETIQVAEEADVEQETAVPAETYVDAASKETSSAQLDETIDLTPKPEEKAPAPKPLTVSKGRGILIGGVVAVAALLLGGIYLAGVIFRVELDEGTVVIEIGDSDKPVEVTVTKDDTIKIIDPNDGKEVLVTVETGANKLTLKKEGFEVQTEMLSLKSKDGRRVKVTFVPVEEAAVSEGHPDKVDYNTERDIAERIISLGGMVSVIDFQARDSLIDWRIGVEWIKRIDDLPTVDLCVQAVSFYGNETVTDDQLEILKHLSSLTCLDLFYARSLTPACLIQVGGVKSLRAYQGPASGEVNHLAKLKLEVFCSVGLSDEDLSCFANISTLRSVGFLKPFFTDEGLKHLSHLQALREVSIDGNDFCTDAGLTHLADLPVLESLYIRKGHLTGEGFEAFKNHDNLRYIDVSYCPITDDGLATMSEISSLECLCMHSGMRGGNDNLGPRITANGLRHLADFQNLASFDLAVDELTDDDLLQIKIPEGLVGVIFGGRVTPEGAAKFLQTHPAALRIDILLKGRDLVNDASADKEERVAAEWIMESGGEFHCWVFAGVSGVINTSITKASVQKGRTVPAQPFRIYKISFDSSPAVASDEDLTVLTQLAFLRELNLTGQKVTAQGVAKLQDALPNCKIIWDGNAGKEDTSMGESGDGSLDREVAEWVLEKGGMVVAATETQDIRTKTSSDLPSDPFRLTAVDLRNSGISDADMSNLAGLQFLEVLELHDNPITSEGIERISHVTSISFLGLCETSIDADVVQYIDEMPLGSLMLTGDWIDDEVVARVVSDHSSLKYLRLETRQLTSASFDFIARLDQLDWLSIANCQGLTRQDFQKLTKLRQLRHLDLGSVSITSPDAFDPIGDIRSLEDVRIYECPGFSDDSLAALHSLSKLERLQLYLTNATGTGFQSWLEATDSLKALVIQNCAVNDDGLGHIAKLHGLVELSLIDLILTDHGLEHLRHFKSLTHLQLVGDPITDSGLTSLTNMKSLSQLGLGKLQVTAQGVAKLQEALPECEIIWDGNAGEDDNSMGELGDGSVDREVAEWVLSRGGYVEITDGAGSKRPIQAASDIPTDAFAVRIVRIDDDRVDRENLARLRSLTNLEYVDVYLHDGQVTDNDLSLLGSLPSLKKLALVGVSVTNGGLVHLRESQSLEVLNLSGNDISDVGLEHLSGMRNLKQIELSSTQVTGSGLQHLAQLDNLKCLDLRASGVTDAGIKHIDGLVDLTQLLLDSTNISDQALSSLEAIKMLTELTLANTKITDAGLEYLAKLPALQRLVLTNDQVTAQGVAKLQEALPNCEITWDGKTGEEDTSMGEEGDGSVDREVALKVLAVGGTVGVSVDRGEPVEVTKTGDLPVEEFFVVSVQYRNGDATSEDSELIGVISTLKKLETLNLYRTAISGDPTVEISVAVDLLGAVDWLDGYVAAEHLGCLGAVAAPALPDLHRALNDEDVAVRTVVKVAIEQIEGPQAGRTKLAISDDTSLEFQHRFPADA